MHILLIKMVHKDALYCCKNMYVLQNVIQKCVYKNTCIWKSICISKSYCCGVCVCDLHKLMLIKKTGGGGNETERNQNLTALFILKECRQIALLLLFKTEPLGS